MEGKKVASIKNQPLFCQRIGLRKSAMFLKGNGCGTMDPTLFIQKKAALTWLNRPPAKEMVGLILSTKIGGGSLMHANCRGKNFFFFFVAFDVFMSPFETCLAACHYFMAVEMQKLLNAFLIMFSAVSDLIH
jgi:hypothetical protein